MKHLIVVIFVFLFGSAISQRVVYLEYVPESSPGAGDNKLIAHNSGLTQPVQFNWYLSGYGPRGNTSIIENITPGSYSVTVIDSACFTFYATMYFTSNAGSVRMVENVEAVLPTPGNSDGSIRFTRRNYQVTDEMAFGPSGGSQLTTTDTAFFNLPEDQYTFNITPAGSPFYGVRNVVNLQNQPLNSPCYHFDKTLVVQPPSNFCVGQINVTGSNSPETNFEYFINVHDFSMGSAIQLNSNSAFGAAYGLCTGFYSIETRNWNNKMQYTDYLFLQPSSSTPYAWNNPDSILPGTDTVVLFPTMNCGIVQGPPIDTMFISSIVSLGSGQFQFSVAVVQAGDTSFVPAETLVDTTQNFFVDLSMFCVDTSRTVTVFERYMVYWGERIMLSVPSFINSSSVKLFPNPSREQVMLEFDLSSTHSLHFRVVDVSGREIYFDQQSYSQGRGTKTIQISGWESGVYFVSVYDRNSSVPLVSGLKLFKY